MIELIKKGQKQDSWIVEFNGEKFSLKKYADTFYGDTFLFPYGPLPNESSVTLKKLKGLLFKDVPGEISLRIDNEDENLGRCIYFADIVHNAENKVYYGWELYPVDWKGSANPFVLRDKVAELLKSGYLSNSFKVNKDVQTVDDDDIASLYFSVHFQDEENIQEFLFDIARYISECFSKAENEISIGDFSSKIVSKFSISDDQKSALSTYLTYFIEFLRDLGVNADYDLNMKGRDILFSVIPESKEHSLKNISEALSFYLQLPQLDVNTFTPVSSDPMVELKLEKLKLEVERLKNALRVNRLQMRYESQFELPQNADLEIKDSRLPVESLHQVFVDGDKQNKKEFLGGGIKLGTYKKFGLELNWAEIWEHLVNKPKQ